MKDRKLAIEQLIQLKVKSKFESDDKLFYPGVERKEIKSALTLLINASIDDFIIKVNNNAFEKEYQDSIQKGLDSFEIFDLDTEDRERVCIYFEEIMDVIGLESSGGIINNWLYGFDFG